MNMFPLGRHIEIVFIACLCQQKRKTPKQLLCLSRHWTPHKQLCFCFCFWLVCKDMQREMTENIHCTGCIFSVLRLCRFCLFFCPHFLLILHPIPCLLFSLISYLFALFGCMILCSHIVWSRQGRNIVLNDISQGTVLFSDLIFRQCRWGPEWHRALGT